MPAATLTQSPVLDLLPARVGRVYGSYPNSLKLYYYLMILLYYYIIILLYDYIII